MKTLADYEYYRTDLGVLYNADCLEILPLIPDNSVDLVLTSPPYNLGNNHHTGNIKHTPYDDDMPENEYQNKQIEILNRLNKIITLTGSLIYNHKNRIKNGKQISPYEWLFKTCWNIKQEVVWFNRSQNFDKCRIYPMTERVYFLNNGKDTFFNAINHHDFFEWKAEGTGLEHTRSFPIEMPLDLFQCYTFNNFLDPFFGSGTTGVACEKLNRKWIGIEISPKYAEIAKKRIEQESRQLKLFKEDK